MTGDRTPPAGDRTAELEAEVARLREQLLDAQDALERLQSQHDVLENFVFGLEKEHDKNGRVLQKTQAELVASYERVRALKAEQDDIFAYIDQGLLLLAPDHRIQEQHSRVAPSLFGRDALAGLRFEELFGGELAKEVEAFVDLLFTGYHGTDAMFARLSPLRDHHERWAAGSKESALSFAFVRVRDTEARCVSKVLVVVADRTSEVSLKRELEERMRTQGAIVERAYQILDAPPALFADFLGEARKAIATVARALEPVAALGAQTDPTIRDLLREVHTLKGNARALELAMLAAEAHTLEDALVELRSREEAEPRREVGARAKQTVERMRAEVEQAARRFERFAVLRRALGRTDGDATTEINAFLQHAAHREAQRRGVEVRVELTSRLVGPAAERFGLVLRNALLALVRNAVAHAAEPPETRTAAGKPSVMLLGITTWEETGEVRVHVRDDGKGIDVRHLDTYSSAGHPHPGSAGHPHPGSAGHPHPGSDEPAPESSQLLRLVSQPGLSSTTSPDELSGRGMGMDIVATAVAELGGRMEVDSAPGVFTEFRIRVPRAALDPAYGRSALDPAGGM